MPDIDLLGIFALVALGAIVWRRETRFRQQWGPSELARFRVLAERAQQEDGQPID